MLLGTERTPGEELAQSEEVLEWALRREGPNSPFSIRAMVDVADQLARQQRGAEESVLRERVVAALRSTAGPEHESTINAELQLARCLSDLGQPEAARPLLAHVVAGRTLALGPEAPETLTALAWSATVAKKMGALRDARELQEQVVAGYEAAGVSGDDVRATLAGLNLASTLAELGDLDDATRLLRDMLDARGRANGPDDPRTMEVLEALTTVTLRAGRTAEAKLLAGSLVERRTRADGGDSDGTARARALLARVESAQ